MVWRSSVLLVWILVCATPLARAETRVLQLPEPNRAGKTTLEHTLQHRRSRRALSQAPLTLAEIGQLLWAAQGITNDRGNRTAPSAGAKYPLEIYVVMPTGVFCYRPKTHDLLRISTGDRRQQLWQQAFAAPGLSRAPITFVVAADFRRTASRYGKRAPRYVHIEVGHAAQNLLLQATALELHGLGVGAFRDTEVRRVLGLPKSHRPLYLLPIGRAPNAPQ